MKKEHPQIDFIIDSDLQVFLGIFNWSSLDATLPQKSGLEMPHVEDFPCEKRGLFGFPVGINKKRVEAPKLLGGIDGSKNAHWHLTLTWIACFT